MTRLEAAGILFCFAVIGVFAVWLVLSLVWGRRQVPMRLVFDESHVEFLKYPHGGTIHLSRQGLETLQAFAAKDGPGVWSVWGLSPFTGKRRTIPVWTAPGEPDFDFALMPPAPRLFDQDNPRPWAHG